MTLAKVLQLEEEDGTGPELRYAHAGQETHLKLVDGRDVRGSEARATPSNDFLVRARQVFGSQDAVAAARLANLGILVASLRDVPFKTVAQCLDLSESNLVRHLHGETSISETRHRDWTILSGIFANLHRVLKRDATERWLRTSIPDLGGQTPLDMLRRHRYDEVLRVTESYLDASFA